MSVSPAQCAKKKNTIGTLILFTYIPLIISNTNAP